MENVDKTQQYQGLFDIVYHGMNWSETKEGYKFWKTFCGFISAPYSDLKHLDNSYTPEQATPSPKWLPIDPNNLSGENVLAGNILDLSKPLIGYLRRDSETYQVYLKVFGSDHRVTNFTHYIPLTDLLNLPIAE
jgi:hypothetical protein